MTQTVAKLAFAEIAPDGRRVQWHTDGPQREVITALKAARAKYVPAEKGGPHWTTPLDYTLVKSVTEAIGSRRVGIGDALREWALWERERITELKDLLAADDAELTRLPTELPELAATLRPDQRVGVAFCTMVDHPLLADEMGLGKTLEAIAAAFESGTAAGMNLVICPKTSAEQVWRYELERWQPYPVFVATDLSRGARQAVIDVALAEAESGSVWLVVNPAMVRKEKFPALHKVEWSTIIADEIADGGVRHPETQTAKGLFALKTRPGGKRIAITGTPWGGKPINGWGILHWLEPDRFSSKWNWAWQWLDVSHNGYGYEIGGIRPDLKDAFDGHMSQHMIARPKSKVLKSLPPKQYIDVWCPMAPEQQRQYKEFAKMAEVMIGLEQLTATGILAEFTRLKQFAGALQEVKEIGDDGAMKLRALPMSGKLTQLEDDFVHLGILDRDADKLAPGGDTEQQAVVFSQFSEIADMLYDHFSAMGVPCLKMTGATSRKGERAAMVQSFQGGEARVLFMTTQTGGVSITLDRASNVFIMDEMWDPDKQRQAEDRCHRASRIHQVTVRYYRSPGTVEEYIADVARDKQDVNNAILAGQVRLWDGVAKRPSGRV